MTRERNFHLPQLASLLFAVLGGACAGDIEPGASVSDPELGTAVAEALTRVECPPAVSDALAVPEGNKLGFAYDAVGDQIYECRANATGFGWALKAPDADLFTIRGHHVIGSHYAGPTWESNDGSKVVGTRLAACTPFRGAIPWLKLGAA